MTKPTARKRETAIPGTANPASLPFCAAVALLLSTLSPAVAGAGEHVEMHFDRIGIADGLSQSAVMAIEQDADGFMWFATEDGLDRYDGFEFRNYRRERNAPASLPNDFVRDLDLAADGSLWVATDGGVARWLPETDSFVSYRHVDGSESSISSDRVRRVLVGPDGTVWIGTRDSGLDALDPATGAVRHFGTAGSASGVGLSSNEIYALATGRDGLVYVGTASGLNTVHPPTGTVTRFDADADVPEAFRSARILSLLVDSHNRLWVGTATDGLLRLDIDSGAVEHFVDRRAGDGGLPSQRVEYIFEDSDHRVWIGTRNGLALADFDAPDFAVYAHDPRTPSSLSDSFVISVFEDAGGIIWFGTRTGGLNKWNPRSWSFGHHKVSGDNAAGPPNQNVTAFTEDREGRLWLGTFGSGIDLMRRTKSRLTHFRHDADPPVVAGDGRIMALLTDSKGTVWAGTMTSGLHAIDPLTRETVAYTHDPANSNSLAANGVMALLEDRAERLWIGTFGGGVSRYDRDSGQFTNFVHDPADETSLSAPRATSLASDESGAIWVGTDGGGLNRQAPGSDGWQRFLHDPQVSGTLPANTVYVLHTDDNGRLWVGTRAGLSRALRDPDAAGGVTFEDTSSVHGLPRKAIYGIESDRHGVLWLSTSQGLIRFDPRSGQSSVYRESHGLQGNEFNVAASYRNGAGELFFGGTNGFNAFDPDKLMFNRRPPKLALTSLSVMNEPAPLDAPLNRLGRFALGYEDDVVTFTVAALDFASPADNRYAYMLEGFDKDWVFSGGQRRITYTNLDGGDYTLRIRGANSDGAWNGAGISLPISVAYPPWRTWWAYAAYAGLALLGVMALWRYQQEKLRREAEYSRRLEQEVRSRTQQLKERNEDLQTANAKLREVSITDALTGLRNRRFVFEQIGRDVDLVLRHYRDGTETLKPGGNNDLLFLVVDLDNFKPVNDTCGHEAGDELLLQVRDVLLEACRLSDDVIRWGGDEFLIVARETNRRYAANLAERIRANLSQRVFSLGQGHVSRVTTSIGYASYPFIKDRPELLNWEEVLGVADAAMYEAKQRRNAWVGIEGVEWSGSAADLCRAIKDDPGQLAEDGAIVSVESLEEVCEARA